MSEREAEKMDELIGLYRRVYDRVRSIAFSDPSKRVAATTAVFHQYCQWLEAQRQDAARIASQNQFFAEMQKTMRAPGSVSPGAPSPFTATKPLSPQELKDILGVMGPEEGAHPNG